MSKEFLVVLVDDNAHEAILDEERKELEAVGGTIRAVDCFSEDDIIAAAKDADVLTTDHAPITRHILESLPNLKAVIRRGVGFDVVDLQAATDNGVVVINIPTFCGEEVSNHVLMFLLNTAKKFTLLSSLTKAGKWKEAKDAQRAISQEMNAEFSANMAEEGVTITEVDKEAWKAAVQSVYEDASLNIDQDLLAQIQAVTGA